MAIAKSLSVYFNGVSLGCALTSVDGTAEVEALDATTLCQSSRKFVPGMRNGTVSMSGIWDYDSTNLDEIHNVFSTAYANGSTGHAIVTLAALADGVDAMLFSATQSSYNVDVQNGQLVTCTADFQTVDGLNFGDVIFTASVNNTTTDGTAYDKGAATSNGGYFVAQVQNPNEYAGNIKLQHSTDNSTWVDLVTFTLTGAGAKYESFGQTVSGTVNRYVRARATSSTGAVTFQAAFARR